MRFDEKVYDLCRKVPQGRVTTYSEIAHALGNRAYRAVGNALNKNPYSPEVPCHRVVSSDGTVGGFAHGPEKKRSMLEKEGISFEGDRITSFEDVFFPLRGPICSS